MARNVDTAGQPAGEESGVVVMDPRDSSESETEAATTGPADTGSADFGAPAPSRRSPRSIIASVAALPKGAARTISRVPRRFLIGAGAVVAVLFVIAAAIGFGGGATSTTTSDGLPPATTHVTQGTLTQTQQVSGLISYGEPVGLVAQQTSGVVTWIAAPGTTVGLGEPIYAVDGQPVVLIHGTVPSYRTLTEGSAGPDVKQLEQSLHDLGYTDLTVDDTYDAATASAVSAWQDSLGREQTGSLRAGDVFVHDGDIRIALQAAIPGGRLGVEPNQQVLTYSGTTQVATIPLGVDKQHLLHEGDPTTITLPGGTTVDGVVASIGQVAQTLDDGKTFFVTVLVSINDQAALADGYDSAPVSISVVTGSKENVLMIPVTALVAAPRGGYAVEVVDGDTTSFVPIETGMFAQGMVEISGPGIAEGTTVGVAK